MYQGEYYDALEADHWMRYVVLIRTTTDTNVIICIIIYCCSEGNLITAVDHVDRDDDELLCGHFFAVNKYKLHIKLTCLE